MQTFIIFAAIAFCLASAREESVFSDDLKAFKNYKFSKVPILNGKQFEFFENSLRKIQNLDCKSDLNATLLGIAEGLPWAVAMYDSSVKVPTGIESGSVYQIGDFDECVNAASYDNRATPGRVASKYCLADVSVDGLYVRSTASRNYQPSNTTLVYWAVCVPSSCNGYDIEALMEDLLGYEVHLDESKCYENKEFEATRGMIIYGCVILCLVMMALFSTLYHCFLLMGEKPHKPKDNECFEMIMKSFSIIENLKKLFQGGNDHLGLNSINGIKALLMLLIVCGHTLLFVVGGPILNADFLAIDIRKVQNAFLLNSILFVDTFLLLSGFLFCRILLRELERRQGKINIFILYIFRYIRLTPAYLAVIGFYMTWFPVIGSGPLWNHKIGLEQQRCEKSWWLNLLYVNNYIGDDSLCMFQSWYLSADTQLFIIAPAIIYLLWKAKRAGIWVLSILAAFSTILPFVLTYVQNLDPTLLVFPDEVSDITTNKFFVNNYVKTHMRTTGYVFGLFIGFLLHNMQEKGIIIPRKLVWILWTISTIVGLGSMFSVTVFYVLPYTPLESALYAGLHRLGWSFATGWLVLAATTGNAGFLKHFLASRFFAPLSRLTYCAYLTNGIVELYQLGTLRTPIYMSHVNLLGVTTAHGGYTVVTALILCLLFESPIHGIEKIFLKRDSQRQHIENRTGEGTPSTSEDSA